MTNFGNKELTGKNDLIKDQGGSTEQPKGSMYARGIIQALSAYLIWGIFPIYWKQLASVSALQLIGHRITWSFVLLLLVVLLTKQFHRFRTTLDLDTIRTYSVAAILISTNWFMYVWAVNHGLVVESSLGYYINPLISVMLGVIVLHERLRAIQWLPLGLAAAGVLYLTLTHGRPPWIALVLASTFGLYGLLKKRATLGPLFGLTLETGLLFLPAIGYLLFCEVSGQGAFLHSPPKIELMLVGAGLVTAVPLLLFAGAASHVPLTMVGILQYVNPTIQFLLGVLVYGESFSRDRLIGFTMVWAGLILFWIEGLYSRFSGGGTPLPELGEG